MKSSGKVWKFEWKVFGKILESVKFGMLGETFGERILARVKRVGKGEYAGSGRHASWESWSIVSLMTKKIYKQNKAQYDNNKSKLNCCLDDEAHVSDKDYIVEEKEESRIIRRRYEIDERM